MIVGGKVRLGGARGKLNCRNLLWTLTFVLAGCAGEIVPQDPLSRRLAWFDLVGGEDIRAQCRPGAPTQARLLYNAIYDEQVRIYDLAVAADGRGRLDTVVLPGRVRLGYIGLDDLANALTGVRDRQVLAPADTGALLSAVEASGTLAPPPVGLQLRSDSFYWTVAACRDGRWHFTGFAYPSAQFAALQFPVELFRLERSGVAVNPPRRLDLGPFEPNSRHDTGYRRTGPRFLVEIGRTGIVR